MGQINSTCASVVSHANGYKNEPAGANAGIFKAARTRLTLRMMSLADFVQTNGLGLAMTRADRIVKLYVRHYTSSADLSGES
jgi:hypothetical protein